MPCCGCLPGRGREKSMVHNVSHLVHLCPHCQADNMTFLPQGEVIIGDARIVHFWNTFYVCPNCDHGFVVEYIHRTPIGRGNSYSPSTCEGNAIKRGFSIHAIHPKPKEPTVPFSIPDDLVGDYQEAERNFTLTNFKSAGLMFRTILDRVTQKEATDKTIGKLINRIDHLAEQGIITNKLKELAHCIREDGNIANHEDQGFVQEQARQMKEFTRLFMTYVYTLPILVEEAHKKATTSPDTTTHP